MSLLTVWSEADLGQTQRGRLIPDGLLGTCIATGCGPAGWPPGTPPRGALASVLEETRFPRLAIRVLEQEAVLTSPSAGRRLVPRAAGV